MKLLLFFTLGSLAFLLVNGKNIKIEIESEDLQLLIGTLLKTSAFQEFVNQIVQRNSAERPSNGFNNPYHPEDSLLNNYYESYKQTRKPDIATITDILDKDNENFLKNENVMEDDDILSDSDNSVMKTAKSKDLRKVVPQENSVKKGIGMKTLIKKASVNSITPVKSVLKAFDENSTFPKPYQRRFVLKGSKSAPKEININK